MITNAQDIINKADIVDIISRRIPVRKDGANRYKANCPFHGGSHWNLKIDPDKGLWYCWSQCKEGGDAFKFFCRIEGLDPKTDFIEAIEKLAQEVGIAPEYSARARQDNPHRINREDLARAVQAAADHYHTQLRSPKNKRALEFAKARGLTDALIDRWHIGYSCGNRVADCGPDPDHLVQAGVLKRPDSGNLYDPLTGRLVIPLRNAAGRIVAFTGRLLPDKDGNTAKDRPKYINTEDTAIWNKSHCAFGYHFARSIKHTGTIYIQEGQLKTIASQAAGIPAISTGNAGLTERQAALAARLGDNIGLAFDPDEAGNAAALRSAQMLRALDLDVTIARLTPPTPSEKHTEAQLAIIQKMEDGEKVDPDDLHAAGIDIHYSTTHLLEWAVATFASQPDPVHRARAITRHILPLINSHALPAVRAIERRHLSRLTGIPESALAEGTAAISRQAATRTLQKTEQKALDKRMTPARTLCAALLQTDNGHEHDPDPTWWSMYIDWLRIPAAIIPWIQTIALIKHYMSTAGTSLAGAIAATVADPQRRNILSYWASIPITGAIDGQTIANLQRAVLADETAARMSTARQAAATGAIALSALAVTEEYLSCSQ